MPSQVVDADSMPAGGELEQHSDVRHCPLCVCPVTIYSLCFVLFQVLASLGKSLVRVFTEGDLCSLSGVAH